MDAEKRKTLESLGWTPELLGMLKRTSHHESIDRMFLDRAEKALSAAGCGALEFLVANPRLSPVELAKRLNRGASTLGITMAAYREAANQGNVRNVAKDMLIRVILCEFPDGWAAKGEVHPLVKIGEWHTEIANYGGDSRFGQYAERIVRSLTIDHPPREGWEPQYPSDPLINDLFDNNWPVVV